MRVLVASTEGAGHFGPLVPFIDALTRPGDEVLVVGPPGLDAAGYRLREAAEPPAEELAAIHQRVESATAEEAAVLVNREVFGVSARPPCCPPWSACATTGTQT